MLATPTRALFWLTLLDVAATLAESIRDVPWLSGLDWVLLAGWAACALWLAIVKRGTARAVAVGATALIAWGTASSWIEALRVSSGTEWPIVSFSPLSLARGLLPLAALLGIGAKARRLVPIAAVALLTIAGWSVLGVFRRLELWKISESLWELSGWLPNQAGTCHFLGVALSAVLYAALRHAAVERAQSPELRDASLGLELLVASALLSIAASAGYQLGAYDLQATLFLDPFEKVRSLLHVVTAVTVLTSVAGFVQLARADSLKAQAPSTLGAVAAGVAWGSDLLLAFASPTPLLLATGAIARVLMLVFACTALHDAANAVSRGDLAAHAGNLRYAVLGASAAVGVLAYAAPDWVLLGTAGLVIGALVLLKSLRELAQLLGQPPQPTLQST